MPQALCGGQTVGNRGRLNISAVACGTCEGTHVVHALILGRAITGIAALAN